jgi:hypothetical protein
MAEYAKAKDQITKRFIVFSFIALYRFIELYSGNRKASLSFIALSPLKGDKA